MDLWVDIFLMLPVLVSSARLTFAFATSHGTMDVNDMSARGGVLFIRAVLCGRVKAKSKGHISPPPPSLRTSLSLCGRADSRWPCGQIDAVHEPQQLQ